MKCSCNLAAFLKCSEPPGFPVGHGLTKPNHGSAKHKAKEADYDSHLGFLSSSAGTKRKGCMENLFQKMKKPNTCLHSIDFPILVTSLELELICLMKVLSNSEIQ